jgi:hypothetical protein
MPRPYGMPEDTDDYLADVWFGALHWAMQEKDVIDAFLAEVKPDYKSPKSALEAKIDKATGHDMVIIDQFIAWFNINVWGSMDCEE